MWLYVLLPSNVLFQSLMQIGKVSSQYLVKLPFVTILTVQILHSLKFLSSLPLSLDYCSKIRKSQ